MTDTRWIKAWRDALAARGRLAAIVLALVASVAAVTTMGSATAVLTREMPRGYLASNPASAQLEMQGDIDAALLDAVRRQPNVAQADSGAVLRGRIEVAPGQSLPLAVFVVRDFATQSINTLRPQSGAWPPPVGTLLVERSALALTKHRVGDAVRVTLPHGGTRVAAIAGTVHDAGIAPAGMEGVVYAYATPQTLAALGETVPLDLLEIVVASGGDDADAISATVRALGRWLAARDAVVVEARVPPPRRHPHQPQMSAVLAMLTIFSALVLVLGAVLSATIVGGLLAQQVRQIAVMKTLGASAAQIAAPLLATVAALGALGAAIGVPLGLAAAQGFVDVVAKLLNLRIADAAPPAWVLALVVAAGIAAPTLAALAPVASAARRTVRAAMTDHGATSTAPTDGRLLRALARTRFGGAVPTLALRNTLRRRTRLALTLALLAGAGAMFLACLDLRAAWADTVAQAARDRHFDLELVPEHTVDIDAAGAALRALPDVRAVEAWDSAGAAIAGPDGLAIVRRYPDGGHGGFALRSAPPWTTLVAHTLVEGRWLRADDADALVVNSTARAQEFASVRLGDTVTLDIAHRRVALRLVGVVGESLAPGAVYVAPCTFVEATRDAAVTPVLRVALADASDAAVNRATPAIVQALRHAGIDLRAVLPQSRLARSQGAHVAILVVALGFIATLMAVVGLLGLASTLATSAAERTREFGVMKAIGASQGQVARIVAIEGLAIGGLGALFALALSWPLSAAVGGVLAAISNQHLVPQPAAASTLALFAAALLGALAAGAVPAWRAARWTVLQALVLA